MAMTSKDLPQELWQAAEALNRGSAHQDIGHRPVAGPSNTTSFRSRSLASSNAQAQSEFEDFASDRSFVSNYGQPASEVVATSLTWTEEDLRPRPEDFAGVMALLNQPDGDDTLEEALQQVSDRQALSWHDSYNAVIPQDPAPPQISRASDDGSYTSEDYPYLFTLLSLPEEESMSAYLSGSSYTDDVWGLPPAIKQDLDVLKAPDANDAAREKALKRLQMLKSHLFGKSTAQSATDVASSANQSQPSRKMTEADWDWIWSEKRA